ncbi:MAG TPA: hypothetical protein VGS58_10045, partial [Candidatus Sulfopaludibacter sp.]|nr:hypothetical protein [Candidatus Sulfopaludibacter sp.]
MARVGTLRMLALAGIALVQTTPGSATVVEKIAGLPVLDGGKPNAANTIWSNQLVKMLQDSLVDKGTPLYEDLEMVFSVCNGGGFVKAITDLGLPGNYSSVSAVPMGYTSSYSVSKNPNGDSGKWPSEGLKGTYDAGSGKTVDKYTMSYGAEYIRGLMGDPTRTAQQLDQFAKDNFKFYNGAAATSGPSAYGGNGANATIN